MLRRVFLLFIFICISFNCFSHEFKEKIHHQNKIISKIIENKVYVKNDAVKVEKNGIFLRLQGELVPISKLEQDDEGVYFDLNDTAAWTIPPTCPSCGYPWVVFHCSNENCPNY